MLITLLFFPEIDQIKNSKASYRRVQTVRISLKYCKRVAPPGTNKFIAKIRNFDSLGAVFPHFCPFQREIWHSPCQISRLSVSPLRDKKNIFGPLSKNSTGMAALRAGLPDLPV